MTDEDTILQLRAELEQARGAKDSAVKMSEHHLRVRLVTERAADDIHRKNIHLLYEVQRLTEEGKLLRAELEIAREALRARVAEDSRVGT